uniref:Signal peptide protein n=1 Tax=Heterorhabditis bacteriophora TaxID=37862 RepID=A0A1I7WAV4_HETBA
MCVGQINCFVFMLLSYRFALVTERLFLCEGISLPLFIGRVWQEEGERNEDAFWFLNGTDPTLQIPLCMTYTTRILSEFNIKYHCPLVGSPLSIKVKRTTIHLERIIYRIVTILLNVLCLLCLFICKLHRTIKNHNLILNPNLSQLQSIKHSVHFVTTDPRRYCRMECSCFFGIFYFVLLASIRWKGLFYSKMFCYVLLCFMQTSTITIADQEGNHDRSRVFPKHKANLGGLNRKLHLMYSFYLIFSNSICELHSTNRFNYAYDNYYNNFYDLSAYYYEQNIYFCLTKRSTFNFFRSHFVLYCMEIFDLSKKTYLIVIILILPKTRKRAEESKNGKTKHLLKSIIGKQKQLLDLNKLKHELLQYFSEAISSFCLRNSYSIYIFHNIVRKL